MTGFVAPPLPSLMTALTPLDREILHRIEQRAGTAWAEQQEAWLLGHGGGWREVIDGQVQFWDQDAEIVVTDRAPLQLEEVVDRTIQGMSKPVHDLPPREVHLEDIIVEE